LCEFIITSYEKNIRPINLYFAKLNLHEGIIPKQYTQTDLIVPNRASLFLANDKLAVVGFI
jgi:hypothetical protein